MSRNMGRVCSIAESNPVVGLGLIGMKGAYSLVFGFGLSDAIMAQHRSAVRELDPVPAELFLSTCTGARKFRLPGLCGSAMHWYWGVRDSEHHTFAKLLRPKLRTL